MRKLLALLIFVVLAVGQLTAQTRKISGKVTNQAGEPVVNASVLVKGTTVGTTTLNDGTFMLNVPSSATTLVISSINFTSREVAILDNLNVVLQPATGNLSEVVVVAYGSIKKTNLTGAVGTIKGGELENKPFSSVDKAMQGSVAGLQSSSSSGAPGSSTEIRIRGVGSLTASSNPLWVIDGVIATTGDISVNTTTTNTLSSINPDDIESISVLKDASASAIYGSRGANGVILVTTKKGRAGKSHLNFSTEIGNNDLAFKNSNNRSLTTLEYQKMLEMALINANEAADIPSADAIIQDPNNGFGLKPGVNTNWLNEVTQKGSQQQYNLNISGGNDKTTFYASGGFFKQLGTTIATDFKRYNGSISMVHKATDWATFSAGFSGSSSSQNTPTNGGTFANPVLASFFLLPWYSPRNADGSLKYNDPEGQFSVNGGIFNPLVQAAYNRNTARQTTVRGYTTAEIKIMKDLKFTSRYSGQYIDLSEDQYRNPFYGDGYAAGGDAFSAYTRVYDWTFSNFADYHHDIVKSGDLNFDLKLGYEASGTKNYSLQAGGQAFPANLGLQYLASAATPTTAYAVPAERTNNSIFSIVSFNYKDRYILSGSFRRDGSSVFGANNLYGNFYSVGASWNINEEDFVRDINWINLLKLRASYGGQGNSNGFGYYQALATYGYGSGYNYTGLPGSGPNNVGNANLTWEKNTQTNVGLDFGLFKNRLSGTVEYYNRRSNGLLLNVPLSPTSGFLSQLQNVGVVENKGIEVTLAGRPIQTKSFSWDVSFNLAHNKNTVISLYNHSPVLSSPFRYTEGFNAQAFYLRQWAGVDPANGDPLWYTDATKKSTTNVFSKAYLGLDNNMTAMPKVYGSFSNTFTYKGLSLSAQFFYNFGNYVFDQWGSYLSSEGVFAGAFGQLSQELTAWQKPGDVTRIPKIIDGGNKNSYRTSTRFLYKGDYIRLRDVQLSYAIPAKYAKKAYMSNLSVYVRGTNLFTFDTDKYIPFDPEVGVNGTANLEVFIPKSITAGIKIGF